MTVADAQSSMPVATPNAAPRPAPTPIAGPTGPVRSRPRSPRRDGLSRDAGRLLAGAFGIAWILCPALEPLPAHDMAYPLWQLPIDLTAVATIVVAVVALWRGWGTSARLGALAGVFMAVETITCPVAGHSPVGWWTWVQAALSLFVMGTSAALMAGRVRRPVGAPPA